MAKLPEALTTPDLLGDTCDLVGEVPAEQVERADESAAARRARLYRERRGLRAMTVNIPAELAEQFDAWLKARDKNRSTVIAHLIGTQLLRKR